LQPNLQASALVVVLAAPARVPRVLGLLAGLLAATLLLAGLLLPAALLVLTALAGILWVLWILVHSTLSCCPNPHSIDRNKKPIDLNNSDKINWFRMTSIQCVNVLNLSQKVEMELFHGEYSVRMMSQLWPAHSLDIDDLGIKGRYLRKLIRVWSLCGTRGNARGVRTVTGKGKWEVPQVRRVMDRLNRAGGM
jgi:hypothetical protein